jgi:acyl-coenzyme A thioesterase PaaI-like protein
LTGKGRVVQRNGDIAFVEASLLDSDQAVVATADATIRIVPLEAAAG